MKYYDVIVIGGGHAGIEAAYAASKMNGKICLLNFSIDTICVMSCNPAVGGLAKGHLAREVDALGGLIGKASDKTGIQFRMLNKTKGPAVWGPRAQIDKDEYSKFMQEFIINYKGIDVFGDPAVSLILEKNKIKGVTTKQGKVFYCGACIITTGTFLNGLTHRGKVRKKEGRYGEKPSLRLANYLKTLDIEIGRLKTGTPCRIHRDSIDYSKMIKQEGDSDPMPFSFATKDITQNQINCHMTHTTDLTKKIILDNIHLSALYGGFIKGVGPRYCPSIEDKYVKFKDKDKHLIFIEPEGISNPSIYINGASSSLPSNIQKKMIRSIIGLENAKFLRIGYAIEYDFVHPTELFPTLEIKKYENIFLAGQINGTSGYEEAASQGIIAGINAMLKLGNKSEFVLKRSEAYIGVLMDDLVTKGVDEPYRMFTSRAEFRLMLRQDTADRRLTEYAYKLNLVSQKELKRMKDKKKRINNAINDMNNIKYNGRTIKELYLTPNSSIKDIKNIAPQIFSKLKKYDEVTLFADVKYEGYMKREKEKIQKLIDQDEKKIPKDFDYFKIKSMRVEAKEKFSKILPLTINQAKKIPGISPSDIQLLLINLEKPKSTWRKTN